MLDSIIKKSLNNRITVLVSAAILLIAGVYTAKNMDIDVFPDLNAPTVVVMTEAKGMAPEEVERLVSFPIETAVNGATDVRRVRSSSTMGFSVVWVEFNWGTDIYLARQIVTEKLTALGEALPDGIGKPTLGPQSSILGEVLTIGLSSETISQLDLRTIADWTIRPRLLSVGGVAQVTVIGGEIKEYQILLDPGRMRHYGISLEEVLNSVENMNKNAAGGVLYEYGSEYIVRGMMQSNSLEELGKGMIKKTGKKPVLLEDIADIEIGAKAPKSGLASEKGKPAVLMTVTKQPNTSTIQLTEKLDKAIESLKGSLPAGVNISSDIFRQERFINNSIDNIKKALMEGAFFVVIILILFLMNGRTVFISLLSLPLSLLATVIILKLFGQSINTMSLGGMAIAIGSLVDDAVIDVENVFKRLRENRTIPEEKRESVIKTVYEASKEVRLPILNSTLIIVASFIPLFFLSGMEGRMLRPLGIAFIVSLTASTCIALTVTPVLCSYLLGKKPKKENREKEPALVIKLKSYYEKTLSWSLNHKKIILGATAALLISAIIVFTTLGSNFLPAFNEGSFTITINTLPGISLEESDRFGRIAEERLLTIEEVQTTGRKTGRAELDEHSFGVNTSEIEAPFRLNKRSKEELTAEIREKLGSIPGISVEIGQPISHRIDHMLSGTKANIAIKIFGPDLNRLYLLGSDIKHSIEGVEGLADLNLEQQVERPQLKLIPRRGMLAKYGIKLPEFSEYVNTLLNGRVVSQVYEEAKTFDLILKVNERHKDAADKINDLIVDTDNGRRIPFEHIADIQSSMGPNTINRENVQRKVVVSANVAGRDLRGVVNEIRERIEEEIEVPEAYHIEYGGQFESEQAASRTLYLASILAIMLIFMLIYNQFRNAVKSAVILINLPLALIGGVYALLFTGGEISIPAIIGFISLFGIATRNGMLLMAHYDDLRARGQAVRSTIIKGSLDRLNPILMTALSSGLALIPLAVQGELPGNEIQSPMAIVIIGGLLTSTFLNMYVIPLVYNIINSKAIADENI